MRTILGFLLSVWTVAAASAACTVHIPDTVAPVGALVSIPILMFGLPASFDDAQLDVLFQGNSLTPRVPQDAQGTCVREAINYGRDRLTCAVLRSEAFGTPHARRLLDLRFTVTAPGVSALLPTRLRGDIAGCTVQAGLLDARP
jgi:hypothetical protein